MIRDHIEDFELSDEFLKEHLNETNSLQALAVGLDYLYRQVKRIEDTLNAGIGPNVKAMFMGNIHVPQQAQQLVVCAFHWYAVSVCNCVRLVAWLRRQRESTAPTPDAYVKAVLPDVIVCPIIRRV